MKSLKIFIIVGVAFLLGAAGTAGFVWYLVQDTLPHDASSVLGNVVDPKVQKTTQTQTAQETLNGSVAETVPEEGVALPSNTLSEKQKAIAESVGVDVDSFVLTPQMVECAEEKLGTARIQEIMLGDAPSVLEAARLTPCL